MQFRTLTAALFTLCSLPCSAQLAATVNGEEITLDDWIARMRNLKATSFIASNNPLRFKPQSAGQIALESLINEKLLIQYASKTSLLPPDSEVDAEVENQKKNPQVASGLQKKMFTLEQLRNEVRAQKTLFNVATINQSVKEEEVRAYWQAHPELFGRPERWNLAMIRVTGKEKADKVASELKTGKPFATVAAEISEDPSGKKSGGALPPLLPNDPALPPFIRDAVSKLKVGEVSPAITPAGSQPIPPGTTFFVRLIGKEEATLQPFEQVKPAAERMALLQKVGGFANAERKIADFRKTSAVVIHMEMYKDIFTQTENSGEKPEGGN